MGVLNLVNTIISAIDGGKYCLGVFLDLSKAFNTIGHNIPGRNLRSGKKNFFVISPVLTKTYGERTFAHAAPIMWNNLPDSLTQWNISSLL